jgi:hypothetical protein
MDFLHRNRKNGNKNGRGDAGENSLKTSMWQYRGRRGTAHHIFE